MGCRQVEAVHRTKTCLGCFRFCSGLDSVNFPEPYCVPEIFIVERPFNMLLKVDRLWNDLKLNEWACQENTIGLFEEL